MLLLVSDERVLSDIDIELATYLQGLLARSKSNSKTWFGGDLLVGSAPTE